MPSSLRQEIYESRTYNIRPNEVSISLASRELERRSSPRYRDEQELKLVCSVRYAVDISESSLAKLSATENAMKFLLHIVFKGVTQHLPRLRYLVSQGEITAALKLIDEIEEETK